MGLTDEQLRRKHERQQKRQAKLRTDIQDALAESQTDFGHKFALSWGIGQVDRAGTRKLQGHPGSAAALYASEALGEFRIDGRVKAHYQGLTRSAGEGAHGVTEGTIEVALDLIPMRGMTQTVDVPITVKNGYMIQPGIMYHQGSPYIICQSAIDDILSSSGISEPPETDRAHIYATPRVAAALTAQLDTEACGACGMPHHADMDCYSDLEVDAGASSPFSSKRDEMKARQDYENRQKDEQMAAAKAKLRRRQQKQQQTLQDDGLADQDVTGRPKLVAALHYLSCDLEVDGVVHKRGSRVWVRSEDESGLRVRAEDGSEFITDAKHLA